MLGSKGTAGEGGIGAVGGGGEGGLVKEAGLLSFAGALLPFGTPAAKAGREHRHNNPVATRTALQNIEASEFLFVAASKDHEHHNSLAIFFIR
jgi:hypothetical protein